MSPVTLLNMVVMKSAVLLDGPIVEDKLAIKSQRGISQSRRLLRKLSLPVKRVGGGDGFGVGASFLAQAPNDAIQHLHQCDVFR